MVKTSRFDFIVCDRRYQWYVEKQTGSFLYLFRLDHTYGTGIGYYMYIETSSPQKQGDKARLISPEYQVAPGGSCVQFFYHMWGDSTGALNVYLKAGANIEPRPLWALSGDQGDLWRPARATVKTSGKFQVNNLHTRKRLDSSIY